jgi:integrase
MVKRITLHKFVNQNGYELIEKIGKTQTSLLLKISRPTIDAILEKHPTPPQKTIPKYVFEWEETEGNKLFIEKYQGKLRALEKYVQKGMSAWLLLGKKDPLSWDIADFRVLWKSEEFRDQATGQIRFFDAISLRKWMRAMEKADICNLEEFETKGLKRPKGARKQWFLEDEEIMRLIEAIDRKGLLVSFVVSLLSGGRASSVMKSARSKAHGIRPIDIDDQNNGILMFEPKRQEYILRLFHSRVVELVKRYILDQEIKPNESLFLDYNTMRRLLKEIAQKAGVSKIVDMRGSWHITKHTFVSQGAYHGLSLEVISEQTGTDANTLMEYYAGIKEKKMRLELLGEKVDIEPFHVWALRVIIEPAFRRYEQLKVTNGENVTSDKR